MTVVNAEALKSVPMQELAPGQRLFSAGDSGPVWQVVSGAVRLEALQPSGMSLVDFALPGDLIGAESVLGKPYAFFANAVIASQLREIKQETEEDGLHILSSAFRKGQERAASVMRLREGSVAQRIDHLLALLQSATAADSVDPQSHQLPQLREIAGIIGSTPETVCRNLTLRLGKKSRRDLRYVDYVSIAKLG